MQSCPVCSSPPWLLCTPVWYYCRRTSKKMGAYHYILTGCKHSEAIWPSTAMVTGEERKAIAERWDKETERLFTDRTSHWTAEERTRFADRLRPRTTQQAADSPQLIAESAGRADSTPSF